MKYRAKIGWQKRGIFAKKVQILHNILGSMASYPYLKPRYSEALQWNLPIFIEN